MKISNLVIYLAIGMSLTLQTWAMSVPEAEKEFTCPEGTKQEIKDLGEGFQEVSCVRNETHIVHGPYWENDSAYVTRRGQYANGKKTGRWITYSNAKGDIAAEANYKNDLLDGISRSRQAGDFDLKEVWLKGVIRSREWYGLPNSRFPAKQRTDYDDTGGQIRSRTWDASGKLIQDWPCKGSICAPDLK